MSRFTDIAAGDGRDGTGAGAGLLDHLDRAASGDGTVSLLRTGEQIRWSDLWREAHGCAGWIDWAFPHDRTLAGLLEPSRHCLRTLLATWLAGRTFASLPAPSRGMGVEEYRAQLTALVELAGATVVLLPSELQGLVPGPRQLRYVDVGQRRPASGHGQGHLVQFTSGSTDRPRGVVLSMGHLAANVRAICTRLAVTDGDVFFSWLPLAHDMGLVGMLLVPAAAFSPELGGATELWLSDPVQFMRDPVGWLRLASEVGGTISAVPNFALDLVARRLGTDPVELDLSRLRGLVVGSDTVGAATLRRFAQLTAPSGLREEALCPAYGLAEATLAVTIAPPGTPWRALAGPAEGSGAEGSGSEGAGTGGRDPEAPSHNLPPVALGPPVPGMRVRAGASAAAPGQIEVTGSSVAGAFLGRPGSFTADGWLRTGDFGFLHDGELHFTGRVSDRLVVRGRNIDAGGLQRHLGAVAGVRRGCCAVVAEEANGYSVVFEPAAAPPDEDLRRLCRSVADAAVRWSGASPSRVAIVERGALPKTPSGKLQPGRLRDRLADRTIVPVVEIPTPRGM